VLRIAQELMGENGFGWCRRLMSLRHAMGDSDVVPDPMRPLIGRLVKQYGYSRAAADARRSGSRRSSSTCRAGSRIGKGYLVGDQLSAADIYWAAMAALVAPLPRTCVRCPR
jgi:glutathione S-transferase